MNNIITQEEVEPGALFAVNSLPDEYLETAFKTEIIFASADG